MITRSGTVPTANTIPYFCRTIKGHGRERRREKGRGEGEGIKARIRKKRKEKHKGEGRRVKRILNRTVKSHAES